MTPRNPRGGARPGAGRPIRGATATRSRAYRLDAGTIATIERLAEEHGLSHAQIVASAVAALGSDQGALLAEQAERDRLRARVAEFEDVLRIVRDEAQSMLGPESE